MSSAWLDGTVTAVLIVLLTWVIGRRIELRSLPATERLKWVLARSISRMVLVFAAVFVGLVVLRRHPVGVVVGALIGWLVTAVKEARASMAADRRGVGR